MGTPGTPEPVKLITGILADGRSRLAEACAVLGGELGTVELASEPCRWVESAYYQREMGSEIWRQFVSLATVIDPGDLPSVKLQTNRIEREWRCGQARPVNLDPGYICSTKLVLASTKDAAHRVYLRDGIYAEVTLYYAHGSWRPYAYTYRDYARKDSIAFFNEARAQFLSQRRLRAGAAGDRSHSLTTAGFPIVTRSR